MAMTLPHCQNRLVSWASLTPIVKVQHLLDHPWFSQVVMCLVAMSKSEEAVGNQHLGKDVESWSVDSKMEHSVDGGLVLCQCKLATLQFRVAAEGNPHPVIIHTVILLCTFLTLLHVQCKLCTNYKLVL